MLKIISVVGARPQIIKCATLSKAITEKFFSEINEVIVHTGQHYDESMSGALFKTLNISTPKLNLGINNLNHGAMTGRMIEGLEKVFIAENPDWIIVYGDTNSTLAAAIAASKLKIKLAHIESGLRSYNMDMPEEVNRVLVDRVSTLLFCPSENAVRNLFNEGFNNFSNIEIENVGDIMYESALHFSGQSRKPNVSFDLEKSNYVLATFHRAEIVTNKDKLVSVISALNEISESSKVVTPLHPRTINSIKKYKLETKFNIIPPVSYLEMLWLVKNSKIVITDSGGVQKEAFFLNKICLIVREETEWSEIIKTGNSKLVGYDKNKIISEYSSSKNFISCDNFYGSGNTSDLIINSLINYEKK